MEFGELTAKEYDEYLRNYPNKCFLQTSNIATLREQWGWKKHFVGMKQQGKLVAATMMLSKKHGFHDEFYALRGPIIDFNNLELLTAFIQKLKEYIRDHNGYMLRIDPYVIYHSRDSHGTITPEIDHHKMVDHLKQVGFHPVLESEAIQAKYMYVIDLNSKSIDDIMREMTSKTRQMIRKNERNGVVIRTGSIDDIELFADIMAKTGERRQFDDRGVSFYRDLYQALDRDQMVRLIFAELDIKEALKKITEEQKMIKRNQLDREKKWQAGKMKEAKYQASQQADMKKLDQLHQKQMAYEKLQTKHKDRITLGGIMYIIYGDEVASLYGGAYEEYIQYQPFYTIHDHMIRDAVENGYQLYNFYAIPDPHDLESSQQGIYQFKKSFGGHVQEFLGEYVLPVRSLDFLLYKIKRKIKK